ncbi:MAG: hypothetical protein KatS3mg059_0957 [Thermomicrobiales bacterium]|nr:MAG: hypothetical protein KatS3mg059_0957 [Thermomicrobiales bacterium]
MTPGWTRLRFAHGGEAAVSSRGVIPAGALEADCRSELGRPHGALPAGHRPNDPERFLARRDPPREGVRPVARARGPARRQKKRTSGRRRCVVTSRIVPRSTGYAASSASSTVRWVTGAWMSSATSRPVPASVRKWAGNTTRIMAGFAPPRRGRTGGRARSAPRYRPNPARRTPARRWCRNRSRTAPNGPPPSRRAKR